MPKKDVNRVREASKYSHKPLVITSQVKEGHEVKKAKLRILDLDRTVHAFWSVFQKCENDLIIM